MQQAQYTITSKGVKNMNIIAKSREDLSMKDVYDLTRSPEVQKMRTSVGDCIAVGDWLLYEDTSKTTGEIAKLLAVKDRDTGVCYATNSATFIEEFTSLLDMCAEMQTQLNTVKVVEGVSKAGRNFITAVYID